MKTRHLHAGWPVKVFNPRSHGMIKRSQARSGRQQDLARNAAAGMSRRFLAPTLALCLGLGLGSCSGFSGFVADRWPHWAGGLPADAPPRPGAPGYDEFVAHAQANKDAAAPATVAADKTNAPAAPAGGPGPNDQGVVQGGLY